MTRNNELVRGTVVALLLILCGPGLSGEPFPFDQELLLDAAPMQPGKRMPILTVESNGNARIELWCRTVPARVELSEGEMKIEAGPLPEELPAMQSAGQCTPERIQADEQMLAALTQVSNWSWQDGEILLVGPTTMKFRSATN